MSSLVDNLSEIYKTKCEKCKERKKSISECKFIGIEDNKLSYKCKECNGKSHKPINRFDKKFPNTHQFCNRNVNKFGLLLRTGIYPYEYMDSREKFFTAN